MQKVEKFERVEMSLPHAQMSQREAKLNEVVDVKQREKLRFIQKLQDERGKLGTL